MSDCRHNVYDLVVEFSCGNMQRILLSEIIHFYFFFLITVQITTLNCSDFYARMFPFSNYFRFRNDSMNFCPQIELLGMRKEKVVGTKESVRLGQGKRDCPARKEEDDGSALSEARLCVNVWLAFGRQP